MSTGSKGMAANSASQEVNNNVDQQPDIKVLD